jgi:hypothetical protein
MRNVRLVLIFGIALLSRANTAYTCATPSGAISCTGTLSTPEDIFTETFTLPASTTITVQTYGFGGGTNANGMTISPGGFDSMVALFSGTATAATILESAGNPVASADNFGLYSPGCPPAGTITVGTVTGVCGDNMLSAVLAAGTYTMLLTDANFIALAVNPNIFFGPYDLTDTTSGNYGSATNNGAYNDLSGGVFQTCATAVDCNTDNGYFAVDITGLPSILTPEPSTLLLLTAGLACLASFKKKEIEYEKDYDHHHLCHSRVPGDVGVHRGRRAEGGPRRRGDADSRPG